MIKNLRIWGLKPPQNKELGTKNPITLLITENSKHTTRFLQLKKT